MTFPETITGRNIRLEKFNEAHLEGLKQISIDPKIWEFLPRKIHSEEDFIAYHSWLKGRIDSGYLIVYTLIHQPTEKIIGSTGFLNFDKDNKKIEIGGTWLAPVYWGTKLNLEAKLLLLDLCFRELILGRVEFKTKENNTRSQKAIEKLGAIKEGVPRWDRMNEDGTFRNTVVYSIIQPEWKQVELKIRSVLA